ncbi:DUF1254 domain-containing protein [Undibacterium umbellatum]|uniref:DUF1254 domain-containing protein n=1 Tax=Undibacterium umbellatum TaxID=2762300 RepID=A0ABR6Z8V6_9BURK|nr:DUF1254 domain-containing protein [Undibacterium umbellatum]MBC3908108.1 DUF1254 domain-containing protein [Undibacterium umbellatum]
MSNAASTPDASQFSLLLPQLSLPDADNAEEEYAYSLGIQAYIYGFPWIYNAQLRWLWASEAGKHFSEKHGLPDLYAPINTFHHAAVLATPAAQTGGAPNTDTLYSTAWLDIAEDPIVISVPAVTDRYFVIEMVCMDADNFAYVGTYATGTEAGNYLIAPHHWNGTVPDGVADILPRSRTDTVFLLGRTGVNNSSTAEVQAANEVQQQYLLTPLADWPNAPTPYKKPVMIPWGVDYNHTAGAWHTMNESMTQNPPGLPPGINQQQLLNLFATINIGPNQHVEQQSEAARIGLQRAAKDGLDLLKKFSKSRGKTVNNWTYPPQDVGRAGQHSDFITRAAVQSLSGICANDPDEAVYINTSIDSKGNELNGSNCYRMTFSAGNFPPFNADMHGFWSVTLYNSTYNLCPGSSNYSINGYYPEFSTTDAEGGITIVIQSDKPDTLPAGSYWLQSPSDESFFLILRVYVPGPTVSFTQTYSPPAIIVES